MFITTRLLWLLALTILAASCGSKTNEKKDPPKRAAPKVDGYIVKTEAFSQTVEVPGTIVANEVTEIHPEVSGSVVRLQAREGQQVGKGTVIAKIYDGDLQAQLKKYQAQLGIAIANEQRAAKLLDLQGISRQDYDATALILRNIQADIEIVKTQISRTEVRAPFSGKMGLKGISPGAYVTPATVIATINQISTLKIDFSVPEKYTSSIRQGQIVSFTVEGSASTLSAKIMATESNVNAATRSLQVRAVVNSPTRDLLPGAFARVKIIFPPNIHSLFVPANAVIPSGRSKKVILSVNGKATTSEVETGVRDASRVEITQGLKPGDTILVSGIMSVKPGDSLSFGKILQ